MNIRPSIGPWQAKARARWQAMSAREQRALIGLATVLALALCWAVAIRPAWQTLRDADAQRSQLTQQHLHMQAWHTQAIALQHLAPMPRDEALRSLQQLSNTSDKAFSLQVQGDRVAVQLKGVPANTLATWLTQARTQAQALPTEAHLTRNANHSAWDGQVVLVLPSRSAETSAAH